MSGPNDRLYDLLPDVVQLRDSQTPGAPLRSLLSVISEQADLLEANIAQLYDDWFIETCQDWVIPYIGDLIGYEVLHEAGDPSSAATPEARSLNRILIPRQDVANTVRARRRKGTLGVLVELARDVAGWPAVAIEFNRLASITQGLNDLRTAGGRTVDLREAGALERIGAAGDIASRLAELRGPDAPPATGALQTSGVGLLIPRYRSYSVTCSTAAWVSHAGDHCFTFSPLGDDVPLFSGVGLPVALARGDVNREAHYGSGKSLAIWTRAENDGTPPKLVEPGRIVPTDLAHGRLEPRPNTVAVDAVLGRISFPPDELPAQVLVSYHYGFSYEVGAGEYERMPVALPDVPLSASVGEGTVTFAGRCIAGISVQLLVDATAKPASYVTTAQDTPASVATALAAALDALALPGISATAANATVTVSGSQSLAVAFPTALYLVKRDSSESHERLGHALQEWKAAAPARAVIEFADSEIYDEDELDIALEAGQVLQIRAASGARPVVRMIEWRAGAPEPLRISGAAGSTLVLDGLLIAGSGLRVTGALAQLELRRSTLVPGWKHLSQSARRHRVEPSIVVDDAPAAIVIEHSILGPIVVRRAERAPAPTRLMVADSILDAFEHGEAIASPDARVAHVELRIARSTVFGRVRAHAVRLAENSIFDGQVTVTDRQHGCFRYCYVPLDSRTPPRFACHPEGTPGVKPPFVSKRFEGPGYARLRDEAPSEIAQGADDRAEMGAFHDLYRAQRKANLRTRLAEYAPAGTDLAILFVS
jgi:hypothetical protein